MKRVQIICSVISAHAVGRAWTGNSRTDSPSNRLYASLATSMFHLPWIKTVCSFCILTIAPLLIDPRFALTVHFTDLVSNRCQPIFFYPQRPLSFALNIRQCQLTISWVTMVTCGPIVFPKVLCNDSSPNHLWFQYFRHGADLQINANCNKLIQKWNCLLFSQVIFFHIYYQRENVNTKMILWLKTSNGTAMPCETTQQP